MLAAEDPPLLPSAASTFATIALSSSRLSLSWRRTDFFFGMAGAALDVYDREPLPPRHRLRGLDNLVATPHLGYVTENTYRIFYGQAVEDIAAWLDGAPVRVLAGA